MTDLRAEFEAFISSPPYEREIDRFEDDDTTAWPGSYKDIAVELAWDAFARGVSLERQACASKAAEDVLAERRRQIDIEGWTAEHDDAHGVGDLSAAGMCYAGHACLTLQNESLDRVPTPWPWATHWWKPTTPRRDLVKAAALLIAEIERIDRAGHE